MSNTFIRYDGELFTFDAKTTEEYTEDAAVPDHPIQNGANVSDHRRDKPLKLVVEGIVSESPFEGQQVAGVLANDLAGRRAVIAKSFFDIAKERTLFWDSSRLGLLIDLLIESVQTSILDTQATKFRISLKQTEFAQSQLVEVPKEFKPAPAQETKQCSTQATSDITGPVNDAELTSVTRNFDDLQRNAYTNFASDSVGGVLGGLGFGN